MLYPVLFFSLYETEAGKKWLLFIMQWVRWFDGMEQWESDSRTGWKFIFIRETFKQALSVANLGSSSVDK